MGYWLLSIAFYVIIRKRDGAYMHEFMKIFLTGGFFISLISIIAWWQLFKKAHLKGWYALIPIYNIYSFCKMVTSSGWTMIILLIPFVNIIFIIYLLMRLSYAFGHGLLFALGLFFFYPLFILILAFGLSQYRRLS